MRRHPRDGEAVFGALPAAVIAAFPLGIGHDRLPSNLVKGDVLRRMPRGAGDHQRGAGPLGPVGGKAQRLHPAHRTANHRMELSDPQGIEQRHLRSHHVADRNHRKTHRIGLTIGGGAGGASRTHAAAQHIGANHEISARIDHFARPDRFGPPPRLAGLGVRADHVLVHRQRVEQQHRVGFIGVEGAASLVRDRDLFQHLSAVERQRRGQHQRIVDRLKNGFWHRPNACASRCALSIAAKSAKGSPP